MPPWKPPSPTSTKMMAKMNKPASPIDIIAAIRIGICKAEHRFTHGGCFQLYRVLKQLYPEAAPWYDSIRGHVYVQIGEAYYDIDGAHERGERWELMTDNPMLLAKAHGWDF